MALNSNENLNPTCSFHPDTVHTTRFIQSVVMMTQNMVWCCEHSCTNVTNHQSLCCVHGVECPSYRIPKTMETAIEFDIHQNQTISIPSNFIYPRKPDFEIRSKCLDGKRRRFHTGDKVHACFREIPTPRTRKHLLKSEDLCPMLNSPRWLSCRYCEEKVESGDMKNMRKHISDVHFICIGCVGGDHPIRLLSFDKIGLYFRTALKMGLNACCRHGITCMHGDYGMTLKCQHRVCCFHLDNPEKCEVFSTGENRGVIVRKKKK